MRDWAEGTGLDDIQNAWSLAGMVPGIGAVPDLANAALYASRGKWADAAFSGLQALPFIGTEIGALRLGSKAGRIAGVANDAMDAVSHL